MHVTTSTVDTVNYTSIAATTVPSIDRVLPSTVLQSVSGKHLVGVEVGRVSRQHSRLSTEKLKCMSQLSTVVTVNYTSITATLIAAALVKLLRIVLLIWVVFEWYLAGKKSLTTWKSISTTSRRG